jgi:DNA invertase Pin-like site-specific DNA recombinase
MQIDAMHEFATRRGWTVIATVEEIASGAKDRPPKRHALLTAAKQRKLDVILVWKLDRWGRFLAVFAEFERDLIREWIKAGITDARKRGKAHGRPRAQTNDAAQIRVLAQQGLSQAAIARHLGLWRTSVRRVLAQQERT